MARIMLHLVPELVIAVLLAIVVLQRHKRNQRQKLLILHGMKVCGMVRHVKHEWLFRGSANRHYELYAEFEYEGQTYYALRKSFRKPPYQKDDPIGICFNPENPNENVILDFSDSDANKKK